VTCPALIGTVAPPSISGPGTARWGNGFDQRGDSFWFPYDSGGVTHVEEWDLTSFTLTQTIALPVVATDFFGGDGAGGVTYLTSGGDIKRRSSGGTVTTLLSPATVYATQDATRNALVNVERTTFSAPFVINIDRVTMSGSVTNIVTGLTLLSARMSLRRGALAVTPDGAVWWFEGQFGPFTLSRYYAGTYSHGLAVDGLTIFARPDNTVATQIGGVLKIVDSSLSTTTSPCGVTEANAAAGFPGQNSGVTKLAWAGSVTTAGVHTYPIYEWAVPSGGWSVDSIRF
jgi:hypothetical protein